MIRPHQKRATVFGGSGFVGTQIVQRLARRGYRVLVAVRRPDLAGHLVPLGSVGQIVPVQANLRNADSIARAVAGADLVINLVGIRFERGRQSFSAVHDEGAGAVARAARAAGVAHLVHMSALGVDRAGESLYAQTKLAGERAVLSAFPEAVVMRPSLMFGQGDGFFNLMGSLARYLPAMPLIHGKTLFQPVYVADVAEAFVTAGEGTARPGAIYELGGPETLAHKALLERILSAAGRRRPLVPIAPGLARLMALPFAVLPFPPLLTADQVTLLSTDNVVSEAAHAEERTLGGLGIAPTAMDTILPSYMWRFRKHGQFDRSGNDRHTSSTGTTI